MKERIAGEEWMDGNGRGESTGGRSQDPNRRGTRPDGGFLPEKKWKEGGKGRAEQGRKERGFPLDRKKNTDKNTMRGDNSAKGEEKSLPWSGREGCRDGVCVCVCHCVREGEDRE